MGKKITFGILLLIALIIMNIVIGGIFVFFIQDIKDPKIDVQFHLSRMTTDELRFTATIAMKNDNHFDLLIKNLSIIGKTPDKQTIVDIQFAGGTIPSEQQKSFTTNDTLSFSGDFSSTIYSSIHGLFGVTLAGVFEKTIPFHINITAEFQELLSAIATPTMILLAEVTEITEDGVDFKGTLNVENPNFFEITLEDFTTSVETEQGNSVGEITRLQGIIHPNGTTQIPFTGTLSYEALNAKTLIIRITGKAGVHLMGLNKSVPLNLAVQLPIPEIKQLVFHNESLGVTISLDVKLRLRGVLTTIGLKLTNPSKIPLQAHDLLCSIYGLTGDNQKMMAQNLMEPSTIEPEQQDYLETKLLIPYIKVFTSGTNRLFPEWFVIRIDGNFSIAGVNQSIPVSIDATINPHLFLS